MSTSNAIPSLFELPANRVWRTYLGGETLDLIGGAAVPADGHFPEDWIASTTVATNPGREDETTAGLSHVSLEGRSVLLRDLFEQAPEHMLGARHVERFGTTTGFLLKFLDSSIRLHLQCHPTAAFARRVLGANSGKTEGYYILDTRPEVSSPYVLLGFQRAPTRAALRDAIEQQDTARLLSWFDPMPVAPGDSFMVPGGMPHAIGEGVFMVEIMEPTDFAVRVEFERGGYTLPESARFMSRGIEFALDMFEVEATSHDEIRERLFAHPKEPTQLGGGSVQEQIIGGSLTDKFRLDRVTVRGSTNLALPDFYVLIVTRGTGTAAAGTTTVRLKPYTKAFVPFATDAVTLVPDGEVLEALVVRAPAVDAT